MKALLGALVKDLPRYVPALMGSNTHYLALCNRGESLELGTNGTGYRCLWRWTSDLSAPQSLPFLGRWLMRRALRDHPIRRFPGPASMADPPAVSFVIGHRGAQRIPHLFATLESIAGQRDVSLECLVIEQDKEARLPGHLPDWVRHVHTPPPSLDMPYCRAWTFNVGARLAQGRMLVLHDNDMLIPADYAARILDLGLQGWEAINLKRFIFFLSQCHTERLLAGTAGLSDQPPATIMQNAEGGGSIAIGREAFQRIGGMDEGFIGWGGEDNEFWERCQTLKVWPYGSLPLVHLWHPHQPGKHQQDTPTLQRYQRLSMVPVEQRIARLRGLAQGGASGPCGWKDGGLGI